MEIEYKSVQELLKSENISYPDFSFFSERGTVVKVAYWQPKGEIKFCKHRGFYCDELIHYNKAREFLNYAKNGNSDIVITPEYSVSWNILKNIIEKKDYWPESRKLWCLGMEGTSCEDLKAFKMEYEKSSTVNIFMENWENVSQNNFVSCLVYLFYSESKLVCIIQLKTTAASDRWAELEAMGLSTGNTIYYFQNRTRTNCLFSFICADALNQSISIIEKNIVYQKCIILHPQLNPKPLHDSFNTMRKSFLDYSKSNIRIISINWSKGTTLKREDGTEIKVEDSYSACFYNETEMNKIERLIARNKKKGIDVAKDGHIFVWHMPSNEHSMSFFIDCFDSRIINNVSSIHNEPLGNVYLEYVDGMWREQDACKVCSIDWDWLKEEFDFSKCSTNECDVLRLHKFFAILFGERLYKDIVLFEGKDNTVFNKRNKGKKEVIHSRERCKYIHEELKDGNVPTKFSKIKQKKFKWVLSSNGNLDVGNSVDEELINVVYVDSADEILIKKGIIEFQNLMGEAANDRMLLYYMSRRGIRYYDDLYNTEINNPNYTKSVDSIK